MPHLERLGITPELILNSQLVDGPGDPIDDEVLAVSAASVGLAAIPNLAHRAVIEVQGAGIRYTYSGRDATAARGYTANVGDIVTLRGPRSVRSFRAIRSGGTDAELFVTYETGGVVL